jgi:outer membrane protein assembly factor BamE (lipoprotein component of BamABCDE complex)
MLRQLTLCSALLGLSLLLPSCLIGSNRDIETTGTYVSETTLAQIKPGQSSDVVLELLGEPTKRIAMDEEGGEVWRWTFSKVIKDKGAVFLIVKAQTTTRSDGTVYVELKDGKVVKTWRD